LYLGLAAILFSLELGAKCTGGPGGGALFDFEYTVQCDEQLVQVDFWLTEEAENGYFLLAAQNFQVVLASQEVFKLSFPLESEIQFHVFDGRDRMRVFSAGLLSCASPLLVGEYFTCDDDAGEFAYHWKIKDADNTESTSYIFDGSGINNLTVQENQEIKVYYSSGTAVTMDIFSSIDEPTIGSFSYSPSQCCPCDWEEIYASTYNFECFGDSFWLLDEGNDLSDEVAIMGHPHNELFSQSGQQITQVGQYLDLIENEQALTLVKYEPSHRCFAISETTTPTSILPLQWNCSEELTELCEEPITITADTHCDETECILEFFWVIDGGLPSVDSTATYTISGTGVFDSLLVYGQTFTQIWPHGTPIDLSVSDASGCITSWSSNGPVNCGSSINCFCMGAPMSACTTTLGQPGILTDTCECTSECEGLQCSTNSSPGTLNGDCDCVPGYFPELDQFGTSGTTWKYCAADGFDNPLPSIMTHQRDTTIQSLDCSILEYGGSEVVLCTSGQQVKYLMNDSLFTLYDFSLWAGDQYELRLPKDLDFGFSNYAEDDPDWLTVHIDNVDFWQANDSTLLKAQSVHSDTDAASADLDCFFEWGPLVEQLGGLNFLFPNCSFSAIDGCCHVNLNSFTNDEISIENDACNGSLMNPCPDAIEVAVQIDCNPDETISVTATVTGGSADENGMINYVVNSSLGALMMTGSPGVYVGTFATDDVVLDISASDGIGCSAWLSDSQLGDPTFINCFTGIEDLVTLGVSVFPNPVVDHLHLSFERSTEIEILDLSGKQVFQGSFETGAHTIDLTDVPSGIYLLKFMTESGRGSMKVLKE